MIEPELIEIIEGPTPDFQPSPYDWTYSLQESPTLREVALTQLRTMTGQDIIERCERAWEEGRAVRLDFPDDLRMRQQVDVVALQLAQAEEGEVLQVWVALPVEVDLNGEEFDDEDDEFFDDEDDDMDDDWRLLG